MKVIIIVTKRGIGSTEAINPLLGNLEAAQATLANLGRSYDNKESNIWYF